MPYDPAISEPRWQTRGTMRARSAVRDERPKYYVLEVFPYPSGRIHMGHVRNYTMGDVVARFKRAQGFSVLHPDGLGRLWHAGRECGDGAGRPSATGPIPRIATMRGQLKPLGLSIDWAANSPPATTITSPSSRRCFWTSLTPGLITRKSLR